MHPDDLRPLLEELIADEVRQEVTDAIAPIRAAKPAPAPTQSTLTPRTFKNFNLTVNDMLSSLDRNQHSNYSPADMRFFITALGK